jgi:hypothetical protein
MHSIKTLERLKSFSKDRAKKILSTSVTTDDDESLRSDDEDEFIDKELRLCPVATSHGLTGLGIGLTSM